MKQEELERIADEYCATLQNKMLAGIKLFEKDWDGIHIRALAELLVEAQTYPIIRKARKEMRMSPVYYQLF